MRRSLSIFVLVLLLAPLALPLSLAGGAPALPICCRPGGAHHCSGMTGQAPQGDGFRGTAHTCPYAHVTLLPGSVRPQTLASVPVPRGAQALHTRLSQIQPAAPATGLQSPRAPPALSSL